MPYKLNLKINVAIYFHEQLRKVNLKLIYKEYKQKKTTT